MIAVGVACPAGSCPLYPASCPVATPVLWPLLVACRPSPATDVVCADAPAPGEAERALKGTQIAVPPLESYAWRLWDFWERHLDPDLFVDHSLRGKVEGKVVVITGGSSGIGKASAIKVAT